MEQPQQTLSTVLSDEIDRFDKASSDHKNSHRLFAGGTIFLTALSTVVAGSAPLWDSTSKLPVFLVLSLTATSTAVAGWAELRKYRELWQHEREIYYALLDIQREYEFRASLKPLTEQDSLEVFARINRVLGSSGLKWAKITSAKTKDD
jgi:hypothetical protein